MGIVSGGLSENFSEKCCILLHFPRYRKVGRQATCAEYCTCVLVCQIGVRWGAGGQVLGNCYRCLASEDAFPLPSQGKYPNGDRARLPQLRRALGDRGPRRHNVVNQQHALARHVTDALEGPDDVLPSLLRRRHRDLRGSVAGACQDSAFNRYAGRLRDTPGEKLGLVVASFPLPAGVQGNGRDSVGADRLIRKVGRHQLGQPGCRSSHVPVL